MRWLDWLRGRPKPGPQIKKPRFTKQDEEVRRRQQEVAKGKRGFDAAETTDRNISRWCKADNRSINQLLFSQLKTLQQRANHEARNSSIVDSTIDTHARDVVGHSGPKIQVEGYSDSWNKKAEEVIAEWGADCSADGSLDIGAWLRGDVRDIWTRGDALCQYVYDQDSTTSIKTKIHTLEQCGLYMYKNDANTIMGVERNRFRRTTQYWIVDPEEAYFGFASHAQSATRIPARDISHSFIQKERGQVRGYPLITPALDPISELREYDASVLGAANAAALMSIWIQNKSELATVEAEDDPDVAALNVGGMTRVPWGWEALAFDPSQPMPQNTIFRTDRVRELGYPVAMPLIHLRHDASTSNYSSARFDAGAYEEANKSWQRWIFRTRVAPAIKWVLFEAMIIGLLPVRSLDKIRLRANWTKPTPIDPVKSAMAAKLRLEGRISSPQIECALEGYEFEEVCAQWKKANETFKKFGLLPILGPVPTTPQDLVAMLQLDQIDNEDDKPPLKLAGEEGNAA